MDAKRGKERTAQSRSSSYDGSSERIFISYSRKDGTAFAADFRDDLLKQQLSVWQDIVSLEGGRDWWSQIEDALKSRALEHFVLVVTPAALESAVMRQEIRLARQEGKTVSPIRGPGLIDLNKLPRWLGQLYELDLPEHWNKLLGTLALPSRQKRTPMMAPEPPADFVKRPVEFDALKRKLLDSKGDAVAISAALRGPAVTAKRHSPRPSHMTKTFRTPISTACCGWNLARNPKTYSPSSPTSSHG
jgi:hypothetical protein